MLLVFCADGLLDGAAGERDRGLYERRLRFHLRHRLQTLPRPLLYSLRKLLHRSRLPHRQQRDPRALWQQRSVHNHLSTPHDAVWYHLLWRDVLPGWANVLRPPRDLHAGYWDRGSPLGLL